MRRIITVLAVAAFMAAMLVVMAAPAFAGLAKGQDNSNFGASNNDPTGDFRNCGFQGNQQSNGSGGDPKACHGDFNN